MNLIKCIPILFVAGCTTVGPDFQQPDIDISQSYIGVEQNAQRSEQLTVNAWWLEFNDPVLNGLIERGLKQNLDIAAAKERIREAEAVMRTTGINAQLDGSADTDYLRSGGEGTSTDNVSTTSLSATFVIDLFGGISREREAAIA
ncbi:TolC family protein [Vibrio natriegens]|nr:TolC family protein [Vibrio natriegens]